MIFLLEQLTVIASLPLNKHLETLIYVELQPNVKIHTVNKFRFTLNLVGNPG